MIFSKITSRSRAEANQPAPGNETTPTTSVAVQQQTSDPQALTGAGSDDPPTYYSTVGEGGFPQNVCATNPTTGVEEHYYSQADPPAIVGEGDFSQTAHTYPSTAGVEEHYYSQADPPATVGEGDSAHSNPTTGVEEPYYSQAQPGSNPPATVSEGDSPQIAHGYPTAGDGSDDSFYHQALTVNKVTIT